MKEIRDCIHGNIKVFEAEEALLDTPQLQRLRHIKQLGFTYLVYPGANHTRFEHSLGVMFLAGRISDELNLHQDVKKQLRVAGLLHDIGHGPFSHTTEMVLEKNFGITHEEMTKELVRKSEVSDVLGNNGFDPEEVVGNIEGSAEYSEVLNSELDADRMDYLVRDAYYTGVAYGLIDLDRLISTLSTRKHHLVLTGGTEAAESLLRARFLMYPTVYEHHAARIAEAMFCRAIERAIGNKLFKPMDMYRYDEVDLISILRNSKGYSKEMIDKIDSRDLFKRAVVFKKKDLGEEAVKKLIELRDNPKKIYKIEAELAEAAEVKNGEILLDVAEPLYSSKEFGILVKQGSEYIAASDASVSIRTLEEAQWDYWVTMVVAPAEHQKKAEKAVKKVLGLGATKQSTLDNL